MNISIGTPRLLFDFHGGIHPNHGVHQFCRTDNGVHRAGLNAFGAADALVFANHRHAIVGAAKLMHTVIADECTGCDLCVEPCPVDCIDMITIEPDIRTWTWTPPAPQIITTDRQGASA